MRQPTSSHKEQEAYDGQLGVIRSAKKNNESQAVLNPATKFPEEPF